MNNIVKTFLDTKDPEFKYKPVNIAGEDLLLINPADMGTHWNEINQYFRSAIVNPVTYEMVSLGFLKFCNFGERPDFQPWNTGWKIDARHKIDGSLLIVSKYKGELIIRTRGTVDARQMANGHEIDLLIKKYPKAFDNNRLNEGWSWLFEWTTPSNIIVLREHDEPTLTLVGCVRNSDCYYAPQATNDSFGEILGISRPQKYEYNSIEECILDVAAWRGKEGVVLYSPDGQTLKKIKADEYCELHKLATGIKGIKQVLDVFMASPKFTDYRNFYRYIETTLDYEIAEKCKDFIHEVTECYGKYVHTYNIIKREVEDYIKPLDTRKEQAIAITTKFKGWQTPLAFCLLDNKEIEDKLVRIAIEQLLEP